MTASRPVGLEVPLSARLRAGTATAHAEAERSPFFAALATGRVTRAQVAALAARLLPVHEALERCAEPWADDPAVQPLLFPGLARSARLRADLVALGRPDRVRSPASAAYADRVVLAASRRRAPFVAHHYTRYLADLSGGQVVRTALHRSLGLDGAGGGSSYVFDGLRPAAVKTAYRAALDALPLSCEEQAEVVGEALDAYRLNTALGRELDALPER